MRFLSNENRVNNFTPNLFNYAVLLFVATTFLVSDWTILYSSFGDITLAMSVLIIILMRKFEISQFQYKIIASFIGLVLLTILLSYIFNDYWISDKRILASFIKLIFYLISIIVCFNFINNNDLKKKFINVNNYLAVLTILIGVIIIVAIYTDNHHISRFFWTYTRQDYRSYYYAGNDSIVRMRSIFSEPAHLGHYLNTIFFANLFFNKNKKGYILIILMLGILLTFSYSMIFIFLITGFSYLLVNTIKGNIKWTKKVWYLVIPMTLVLAMLWDIIYVTIIERTINILSGMDGSAYNRIIESWIYVENERLIFGNGIGHTPPITNIYAYVISDFGLIGFIPYLGLTGYILLNSLTTGILFITMNMAKGGYLNPSFWLFLLFVFLYGIIPSIKEKVNSNELEGKIYV